MNTRARSVMNSSERSVISYRENILSLRVTKAHREEMHIPRIVVIPVDRATW